MVIKAVVKRKEQLGAGLVEFMLASFLSLLIISVIVAVFLSSQRLALAKAKEFHLSQQLNSALQYMQRDIKRAGYNGNQGSPLYLSAIDDVLFVAQDGESISYAYRDSANSGQIRHVGFILANNMLKVCESLSESVLSLAMVLTGCSALFDPKQIKVTGFQVTQHFLTHSLASPSTTISSAMTSLADDSLINTGSSLLYIHLSAQLKSDPTVVYSSTMTVKQRNW
ncbi:hypothetical protein BCU68_07870 [Vibrio sp. 10N.286.49.B3]|uniref:pilus assembly protein PilW n=1 Tax=Vibrio sp. 10N.286.49.B3 TaxID=1880855 RepID=UPI000C83258D|nr:pilus assembly protein PilW [Vibrio sp. 10N.286.49.B3]PMH37523.1 hypothetical protein BCU68_07870 [Vibrio sp. 10N.286.49.B3]